MWEDAIVAKDKRLINNKLWGALRPECLGVAKHLGALGKEASLVFGRQWLLLRCEVACKERFKTMCGMLVNGTFLSLNPTTTLKSRTADSPLARRTFQSKAILVIFVPRPSLVAPSVEELLDFESY